MCRIKTILQNNGGASVTLRCFETYDVDWIFNGSIYYTTANDRYTINTNGTSIQIGRSLMTNGPLVVLLATLDPSAVIAATSANYFGIGTSDNLNSLFLTGGADDDGALRDATLDIGREYVLPPRKHRDLCYLPILRHKHRLRRMEFGWQSGDVAPQVLVLAAAR